MPISIYGGTTQKTQENPIDKYIIHLTGIFKQLNTIQDKSIAQDRIKILSDTLADLTKSAPN
jgi:hypothetical protein